MVFSMHEGMPGAGGLNRMTWLEAVWGIPCDLRDLPSGRYSNHPRHFL
jgi:hypothetical protein